MLLKKMKKILLCICALAQCVCMSAQEESDTLTVLMRQLEDIEVSVKRVQQTTLSTAMVKNEELNRDNMGQNLPYLLSTTPGLQVTSDDGLGIGYTYFRIRGTDHTRINMTVNEVQLNDQEKLPLGCRRGCGCPSEVPAFLDGEEAASKKGAR